MENKFEIQKQIFQELHAYSKHIIVGTQTLIHELREHRQEDTDELFNLVIGGINWEIEVFNNCENLINKDEQRIDKARMAAAVTRLSRVRQERDDIKLAAALETDFLPFLRSMESVASSIIM